jgi:hypothetical protein
VPVELGVTHHTIVAEHLRTDPANVSSPGLPMQKPEAPFINENGGEPVGPAI